MVRLLMGRPRKLTPAEEAEVARMVSERRRMTNKALSYRYGVSASTIRGIARRAIACAR